MSVSSSITSEPSSGLPSASVDACSFAIHVSRFSCSTSFLNSARALFSSVKDVISTPWSPSYAQSRMRQKLHKRQGAYRTEIYVLDLAPAFLKLHSVFHTFVGSTHPATSLLLLPVEKPYCGERFGISPFGVNVAHCAPLVSSLNVSSVMSATPRGVSTLMASFGMASQRPVGRAVCPLVILQQGARDL